jgi:hypothetical protein
MVIVQVAGGLGNQLQQYALYRKFIKLGREARLDISWFSDQKNQDRVLAKRVLELDYFDRLLYEVCTDAEKTRLIGSDNITGRMRRKLMPSTIRRFTEEQMYHPELLRFEDMYVSGYFACEKYYTDILYDLREKIQFPESAEPLNRETAAVMRRSESVSVHIRRGDYLDQDNIKLFGNICTEDYYRKAMEYIKERVPQAHFYIFSDDIRYAREQYTGGQYTMIDWNKGKDSFYDMWLMSRCRYNICANSTFSFWGARLNPYEKKMMIRPTVHKNTQVFRKEEMAELWPGWLFMDNKGVMQ